MARGAQLRDEGGVAHPTVAVAGAGVAGSSAGDEVCSGHSSGASGDGLRCAKERDEVLRRLYAMRGARWSHARDHMVTGASSATSAGGGGCGQACCSCYGVRGRERRGGERPVAHSGHDERVGEVGEEPERSGRRRGSPVMLGQRRLGEGGAGRASARGSACSLMWATAELLDTARR